MFLLMNIFKVALQYLINVVKLLSIVLKFKLNFKLKIDPKSVLRKPGKIFEKIKEFSKKGNPD